MSSNQRVAIWMYIMIMIQKSPSYLWRVKFQSWYLLVWWAYYYLNMVACLDLTNLTQWLYERLIDKADLHSASLIGLSFTFLRYTNSSIYSIGFVILYCSLFCHNKITKMIALMFVLYTGMSIITNWNKSK